MRPPPIVTAEFSTPDELFRAIRGMPWVALTICRRARRWFAIVSTANQQEPS